MAKSHKMGRHKGLEQAVQAITSQAMHYNNDRASDQS
jgi:hypothetical protein